MGCMRRLAVSPPPALRTLCPLAAAIIRAVRPSPSPSVRSKVSSSLERRTRSASSCRTLVRLLAAHNCHRKETHRQLLSCELGFNFLEPHLDDREALVIATAWILTSWLRSCPEG